MGTAPADVVRFNSDPDAVVMLRMRLGRDKATNQPDGGKIVVWVIPPASDPWLRRLPAALYVPGITTSPVLVLLKDDPLVRASVLTPAVHYSPGHPSPAAVPAVAAAAIGDGLATLPGTTLPNGVMLPAHLDLDINVVARASGGPAPGSTSADAGPPAAGATAGVVPPGLNAPSGSAEAAAPPLAAAPEDGSAHVGPASATVTEVPNPPELGSCSICREPLSDVDNLVSTSCNHVFHLCCLDKWRAGHNTCPNCRSTIPALPGASIDSPGAGGLLREGWAGFLDGFYESEEEGIAGNTSGFGDAGRSAGAGVTEGVIMLNVRGLTGAKLVQVTAWLREQQADVGILTETQTAADPNDLLRRQPGASAFWPGAWFFHTPGAGSTGGVVMVLSPDCPLIQPTRHDAPLDTSGRILRVDAFLDGSPFSLIGVYAPAQPVHRRVFFSSTLAGYFPVNDPTPTVVAGDFNVTLHQDDRVACPVPGVHIGASELLAVMGSAHLCDIWRDLNPAAMAFTHWSASTSSGKRLDRFLVSECFSPALTTAALPAATALSATSDILPSAPISTDHLPVSLMVTCMTSGVPRGRGILSFPLRLLNSKEPSAAVSAFIVKTVPPLMVCPASELIGAFDAWKSAFIDMAVGVDKRHRRDRQAPARAADHGARSAREGMLAAEASGGDVGAAATIWLAQKDNAAAAWRALSASAWDVAATLDQNKGETSSYYFHHQAREMHTVTTMLSLNRPGRAPTDSPDAASFVSDAPKATKYVVDFFSSESSIEANVTLKQRSHADT
ncbi:hypothetical protein FOA52_003328 [Chlamydomonas sp. UWO 241]|nr:hypothetical protein FOA52_003328 [Chlamydomonas sp. UWO 241]